VRKSFQTLATLGPKSSIIIKILSFASR